MVGLTVDHTRVIRLLSELVFVFICDTASDQQIVEGLSTTNYHLPFR